jgi:hypothetical protein
MGNKNRRIIVAVISLVLVLCCCILASVVGFVTFSIIQSGSAVINNETRVTVTQESSDLQEQVVPDEIPQANGNELPSLKNDVIVQMDKIEEQVEGIRGLTGLESIHRHLLSPDDLRYKVMNDFFGEYTAEDVEKDSLILSLFGLLERDYDLYNLYIDLYSEQIAGFYDDETKEMVVVQGENFLGPERMTYAHEFTHALQDQYFDLENGLKISEENCKTNSEYCAAVQALVEGDATLTETLWLIDNSTMQDKKDLLEFYQSYNSPIFDSAPEFLKEDFLFAYKQGLSFVQTVYDQGGYAAVDQVYKSPPVTTEQILHPQSYPDDQPVSIEIGDLASVLGSNWEEIDRNNLGEWYTYLVLSKPINKDFALTDPDAADAASGWGGDQYVILRTSDSKEAALVTLSQWDSNAEAKEFWHYLSEYGEKRWGKAQDQSASRLVWEGSHETVLMVTQTNQVLWIIAPSTDILQQLSNVFPAFQQE